MVVQPEQILLLDTECEETRAKNVHIRRIARVLFRV